MNNLTQPAYPVVPLQDNFKRLTAIKFNIITLKGQVQDQNTINNVILKEKNIDSFQIRYTVRKITENSVP